MSKVMVVCPWGNVEAPAFTAAVIAANGDRAPGYSYVGMCPRPGGVDSAILWVDCSDAALAAIKADDVNYIYVEDIIQEAVL